MTNDCRKTLRGSSALATWISLPILLLLTVFPGYAQRTPVPRPAALDPIRAAKEGRELVANLLAQRPPESLTNTGTLRIRGADGKQREKPVSFAIIVSGTNWRSVYEIANGAGQPEKQKLSVIHSDNEPNQYYLDETGATSEPRKLTSAQAMIPFGGSDFWLADLGLEFLHWPNQRVLRKELRRGQSCDVLESTNPTSQADGYVRVVSWIDIGSGGAGLAPIIHADAYEQDGRLLKQFDPKELKKVNGQWQLEEMEMRNRKTGSHTWIIFQLTPSSR